VASSAFVGFEHQSGSSILINELPEAYAVLSAGMTDAALAGQGITVTARDEVTVDGRPSTLIEGTQETQGLKFGKVLLVTGTSSLTMILTGNYPIAETAIGEAIKASALSLSFDPAR
jgi:hypothetical protein